MATIRSTPPRRPSQPRSETRTSYHVGRPWMLDGKMLRGLTGTPMRRIALAKSALAEADPEPFTLANLTTKSLTAERAFGRDCDASAWAAGETSDMVFSAHGGSSLPREERLGTGALAQVGSAPPGGRSRRRGLVHPELGHQVEGLRRSLLNR